MQITIPAPRYAVPGDRKKYPFDELSIGDSFFVPPERAGPTTLKEVVRRRNSKNRGVFSVGCAVGGVLVTRII